MAESAKRMRAVTRVRGRDHVAGHASTNSRLEPKTARLHGERVASPCSETRDHPARAAALRNSREPSDTTRCDATRAPSLAPGTSRVRTTQLINCKLTARLTCRLTYDKLNTRQDVHVYVFVCVYIGTFVGERGGPDVGG